MCYAALARGAECDRGRTGVLPAGNPQFGDDLDERTAKTADRFVGRAGLLGWQSVRWILPV